jgi:hypothetical protein
MVEEALAAQGFRPVDEIALYVAEIEPRGADVALRVRDADDHPVLQRIVPGDECTAMAEAIALLTRRGVRGVRWRGRVPPGPTPPGTPVASATPAGPRVTGRVAIAHERSTWALVPQLGGLVSNDLSSLIVGPRLALTIRPPGPLFATLGVATLSETNVPAGGGWLDITGIPLSADLGLGVAFGRYRLDTAARFEMEIVHAETRGLVRTAAHTQTASRIGAALGASVEVSDRLELHLGFAALGIVQGYRFVVEGTGPVAEQDVVSIEATASVGYRFTP